MPEYIFTMQNVGKMVPPNKKILEKNLSFLLLWGKNRLTWLKWLW